MGAWSETALPEEGVRVTTPPIAVLGVLVDHAYATADLVGQAVRAKLGKVSKQAVSDVPPRASLPASPPSDPDRRQPPSPRLPRLRAHDRFDCATGARPASRRAGMLATPSTKPKSSSGDCARAVSANRSLAPDVRSST